jgi:zinc D-Ala-D-Ala carboxypeptidase
LDRLLSQHFSLSELTASDIAARNGLDNTPPESLIAEGIALCEYELERVRLLVGCPVIVVSGYRSPEVNTLAKGASNSQHMKFQAADIRTSHHTPDELFELIKQSSIRYDQLIQEFDSWVHISHSNTPRRQRFYAKHVNGATVYTPA